MYTLKLQSLYNVNVYLINYKEQAKTSIEKEQFENWQADVEKCTLNITLLVTVRIMVELRFFIFFSCIKYVLFVNKTIQK